MRRYLPYAAVAVALAAGALWWASRPPDTAGRPASGARPDGTWAGLDAQGRCQEALALVTSANRWPTVCRWRHPGELLQGQAFPPPKGPPPYDDPRVEIFVASEQAPADVANAIAHEYGHMRHTREPDFVPEWLAARNLPPDTPSEVWTEDYAEVFAALFSPPNPRWRAPTPRPSPGALAELKARFFTPS